MHPLSRELLKWYQKNKRNLPWRDESDPYLILVSEIMLQQTRVDTVIPYYLQWKDVFPTIQTLAQASEEEVLLVWEGLGYYSRARNLHQAAKVLSEQYKGTLPSSPSELRKLPGVGEYTANAVASICYQCSVIAMDANIKRIFARLMDLDEPVSSRAAKEQLHNYAQDFILGVNAGDFNQALMDVGSLICLPTEPKCCDCPIRDFCDAYKNHTQDQRPILKKKKELPLVQVVAAAISNETDCFLLAKRLKGGMLPGLWEFPGGKLEKGEDDHTALAREIMEELNTTISIGELIGTYRHAYTHFKVVVRAYHCGLTGAQPQTVQVQDLVWAKCDQMGDYAMGKVDRLISRDLCQTVLD